MANGTRRWLSGWFALAVGVSPALAHAQAATSAPQTLFEDGRRLMNAGDYVAACPKLAESQKLDPGGGTLMNLAACHERWGKTATAWVEFSDALAQAKHVGRDDRAREATLQIAALTPRLRRLTVVVTTPVPGLVVSLDGTTLGAASWATSIPIDPGEHELRAQAPDHRVWVASLAVDEGAVRTLTVPALQADAPRIAAPGGAVAATPGSVHPLRVPGIVVAGVGLAGVAVGIGYGVDALDKKSDSEHLCPSTSSCTAGGAGLLRQADTAAWVSDISVGTGIAALAVATWLFFHSRPRTTGLMIRPSVGPTVLGLQAAGAF